MTSHNHKHHPPVRISTNNNSTHTSSTPWLNKNSSQSFSFLKIPPADPKFFSKTSMIQLGYGVWINMTTLVTGLAIGFTAIAFPQMHHEDSIIKITLSQEAWIASVLTLCVPFGSLLGGILMDIYGRQPVLVLCGVPVSLGWFFIGLAKTLNTFIIGCVIISIGLGMMLTAPRAYITEITLPNMRGVIGAMPYFFLSIGFMMVVVLVLFLEWQTISYICGIYSIILMIFNCYLPETPHFVLLSSPDRAKENLKKFRSKSYDVENEMEMLLDFRDENDIRRLQFGEKIVTMFTPSVCKPFAISLTYILLMLCSGCIVVIMWTVEMLELSNTAIVPSTGNLIICITRIIVGIVTSIILYTAKRRMMAILSAAGVGCSAIGVSIYLHTHVGRHIAPIYFYIAYISFAVLGYYTLPLIIMYEILPLQVRGFLSGINITLMNLMIIGMNKGYPYIREAIGLANVMAIFGGISLLGTVILYYILPETSEVTLQEIEEYFSSKRPTLVSSRTIRSDQFISMMKATSSHGKVGKAMFKTSKKIMEHKSKKGLNVVNKEGSKYKESDGSEDQGSPRDGISDGDKYNDRMKYNIPERGKEVSRVYFNEKDLVVSKNKISDKDKEGNNAKEKESDTNSGQGVSITTESIDKDLDKDLGGSRHKTSDSDKDENDGKDKVSDRNSDQESSINKKSDRDKEDDAKEKEPDRNSGQGGSINKEFDRDKDPGGSREKTSDMDKEDDAKEKESDRYSGQGVSMNTESDRGKYQSGSRDKTFYSDKDEDDGKDKVSDRNSGQESSINKEFDKNDKTVKIDKESVLK